MTQNPSLDRASFVAYVAERGETQAARDSIFALRTSKLRIELPTGDDTEVELPDDVPVGQLLL